MWRAAEQLKQLPWVPSGQRSLILRQIGQGLIASGNRTASSRAILQIGQVWVTTPWFWGCRRCFADFAVGRTSNEGRLAAEPSQDVYPLKIRASIASNRLGGDGTTTQLRCSKERGSLPMVVHRLAAQHRTQPKQGYKTLHRRRASSEEGELKFGLRGDLGAEAASCCW